MVGPTGDCPAESVRKRTDLILCFGAVHTAMWLGHAKAPVLVTR